MIEQTNAIQETSAKTPRVTKTASVQKLLSRSRGATLAEIIAVTNWLPHSARAYLSILRKDGKTISKVERRNGDTAYHLSA